MIVNIVEVNGIKPRDYVPPVVYPGIIEILNTIIDWNKCSFPKEIDVTSGDEPKIIENRLVLGEIPELRHGVIFEYRKQSIYVEDQDTLYIANSDTGVLGLYRVVNDYILPEYKLRTKTGYLKSLEGEYVRENSPVLSWIKLPIYKTEIDYYTFKNQLEKRQEESKFRLPFYFYEIFCELFPGNRNGSYKFSVKSEIDLFSVTFNIDPLGRVYYDEDDFIDEDHVKSEILSLLAEKIN